MVAAGHHHDGRAFAGYRAITHLYDADASADPEGLMSSTIASEITAQVIQLITGTSGVNAALAESPPLVGAPLGPLSATQVRAQNVAQEIAEQSSVMQYPAVYVYCEKILNNLVEKFRTFSGNVQVVVEVRQSQDHLDGLQDALENYTDAILQVLNGNRGDWGDGLFYCGAYQATFGAVKRGGRNFIQVAKITFEIGVSRS
jgi:hypothetical protein